jgi:hypothetical protein
MSRAINDRLPADIKENLKGCLRNVVSILSGLRENAPQREKTRYVLLVGQGLDYSQATRIPILQELRSNKRFRDLVQLARHESSILSVLTFGQDLEISGEEEERLVADFLERSLLRITALLDLRAWSSKHGTSHAQTVESVIEEFILFLQLDSVDRRVAVPLLNMEMSDDQIAIANFGRLQKSTQTNPSGVSTSLLMFTIKTGHFLAASDYPLWEEIRKRIALIRMIAHPLVAYNHFSVEHYDPWEVPLDDSKFSSRFWASRKEEIKVPLVKFEGKHAAEIESILPGFDGLKWNKVTPWRLACDRLPALATTTSRLPVRRVMTAPIG